MKYCRLFMLCLVSWLILTSCSLTTRNHSHLNPATHDLLDEKWMHAVKMDPQEWLKTGDSWFLAGQPNRAQQQIQDDAVGNALTTMTVRTGEFSNLVIHGSFQVQIVGDQTQDSVYILGTNAQARQVAVQVNKQTLYLMQVRDPKKKVQDNLSKVIVRVGMKNLDYLSVYGRSQVQGKTIYSEHLIVKSNNGSKILLAGKMNLTKVSQAGSGTISIVEAYSPAVDVTLTGAGTINLSGRVGVQHILDTGRGNINIAGADTNALSINDSGSGTIAITGYVNAKRILLYGPGKIYLYWVDSKDLTIFASDCGKIGLAGTANTLNVSLKQTAQLQAQYLHTNDVFIRTRDWSHANIQAHKQLFAAALDNSSIYFYGTPDIVSRNKADGGIIIPLGAGPIGSPPKPKRE